MIIEDAMGEIGSLLEVDETQYSSAARRKHLNEAMTLLSRQYETRLNEGLIEYEWTAGTKSLALTSINDSERIAEAVNGVIWINPAVENRYITGEDLIQVLTTFADNTGAVESRNQPAAYSLFGGDLHIRPVPVNDVTVRVPIHGTPRSISTGTNVWLTHVPWAVIYRACEIGSLWTGQDQRKSFFQTMRMEHMEMFNIADSSKYDTPMVSEEPG